MAPNRRFVIWNNLPLLIFVSTCTDIHDMKELESEYGFPKITRYDFIIVCGGSAGSVLAGRLSEDFSVLLLGKGGDSVPTTYTTRVLSSYNKHPLRLNAMLVWTRMGYINTKQTEQISNFDIFKLMPTLTGRILGGSGSHNSNGYFRGSPKDYDAISDILNDDSWQYANMLKYFKRAETYAGPINETHQDEDLYGSDGPINVETAWDVPILEKWLAAGAEFGYGSGDPNGRQVESFTPVAYSTKQGIRQSAYTQYIKPVDGNRKLLRVLRYSEVDKILINETTREAIGVAYKRHGFPQVALAGRSVIVSAGAIGSPMLLMKSGMGDRVVLNKAGIPPSQHSPGVGRNLKDHAGFDIQFATKNLSFWKQPLDMLNDLIAFHSDVRGGDLAMAAKSVVAFVVSKRDVSDGESTWPDLQVETGRRKFEGSNNVPIVIIGTRLKSLGRIDLNTAAYKEGVRDTAKLEIVDFNFFEDDSDVDVLVEGVYLALKLEEETQALNSTDLTLNRSPTDTCAQLHTYRSRSYWSCYVQHQARRWNHMTGTCKMGRPDEDNMTVVDPSFKTLKKYVLN